MSGDKDAARGGKARTWNGRYVNIAHRRTPSELTPLIQQNLASQQQVESLTAQNQHMMHQHLSTAPLNAPSGGRAPAHHHKGGSAASGFSSSTNFAPSAAPNAQSSPPPPPIFSHHRGASIGSASQLSSHARQRSIGHVRRHSLAVNEAKRAAQERANSHSAEPDTANSPSSVDSFGSPGPILDSVPQFRFPPSPDRPNPADRPGWGHARSQSMTSPRRHTQSPQPFQFPPAESKPAANNGATQPAAGNPTSLHPHGGAHSRRYSNWQGDGGAVYGHRPRASNASDYSPNQQGRKSSFVPYSPQSAIPEMLADGSLVTGTSRVNHKNRSYAYVSTDSLDADVFIAGSKDRNRALEGDLVAVESLDVDDVWEQKREKEERKRRRGGDANDGRLVETQEGQLRRRGSSKQREPQKRNDDIEVEGQTSSSREEVGHGDEKPSYAGHVVAILERSAGQSFSGTSGSSRPSSQANRERQNHSRAASTSSFMDDQNTNTNTNTNNTNTNTGNNHNNNGNHNGNGNHSNHNKPKIVWFKPVDKCVPLMAIPTEQAPPDLVDNPQAYANQVFVAQIKRWPITSSHPFGMLVEKLGPFGDAEVSRISVSRDFNFGAHKFSGPASDEALETGRAMQKAAAASPPARADVAMLTRDMAASTYADQDGAVLAVHVLDLTPFVARGSALDRESRHKSSGIYMDGYESPLISSPEAVAAVQFEVGRTSPTLTLEFQLETGAVTVSRQAVTPHESALDNNSVVEQFVAAASASRRKRGLGAIDDDALDLSSSLDVTVPARPPSSSPSRSERVVTELMHAVNAAVASESSRSTAVGLNALVRRQSEPAVARLEQFTESSKSQGVRVDTTSAHALARSLAEQLRPRQAVAIKAALAKILGRQRYAVAARTNPGQLGHYWFGFDAYTHFARPSSRYSDHVVARQVHAMLGTTSASTTSASTAAASTEANTPLPTLTSLSTSQEAGAGSSAGSSGGSAGSGSTPTTPTLEPTLPSNTSARSSASLGSPAPVPGAGDNGEDHSGASALAPESSFRYECAHGAQEQSFHLSLAQRLADRTESHLAVVTAVYESAFDVVIPELSVEKRVHGDQSPLVKAEYHPSTQVLELFWKPDGTTQSFQPDSENEHDEEPQAPGSATPGINVSSAHTESPPLTDEMRSHLKSWPEEHVQEIRPSSEVPVLIRVVAADRVSPSIVVVAACPFA